MHYLINDISINNTAYFKFVIIFHFISINDLVTCWLPLGGDQMERRGRKDGDAWDICPWLSGMFSHRGPGPGPQPGKSGRGVTCQLVMPVCQTASPSLIGQAYVWPRKWVWLLEINKDQDYEQSMQLKGFPPPPPKYIFNRRKMKCTIMAFILKSDKISPSKLGLLFSWNHICLYRIQSF